MVEDLYEVRNSIYCYKGTNVLVNKFDVKEAEQLANIERPLVLAKLYDLRQNKDIGHFDIKHFTKIHEFLFSAIYPFAGSFRTENIAKDNFKFAEWEFIEPELQRILDELKNENYLHGLDKSHLANRLAYYMAELNVLHPFRDGNGRTIREFCRQLAYKNGFILNLAKIDAKEMFDASVQSVVDASYLEKLLLKCLEELEN